VPNCEPVRVTICAGSSCYVRGSDELGAVFVSLIEKLGIQERIDLTGAFCMDRCSMGVSVRVGDGPCHTVIPETAADFCESEILPALRGERC
jgi:NADH:ubiquinone oxidoreductase subunit E